MAAASDVIRARAYQGIIRVSPGPLSAWSSPVRPAYQPPHRRKTPDSPDYPKMTRQPAAESPQVSVVVLVYNEIDSVDPLHRELMGVLEGIGRTFEVLYIDDGSSDGS